MSDQENADRHLRAAELRGLASALEDELSRIQVIVDRLRKAAIAEESGNNNA